MAKNKKIKKVKDEVKATKLEKELARMKLENEQMKSVLEDKEKLLKKFSEIKANEKLNSISLLDTDEDDIEDMEEVVEEVEKPKIQPIIQEDIKIKPSKFESIMKRFNETNEGTIEIYRIKENGIEAKIGRYPVKDMGSSLDDIAKKFGGGEYRMILRDAQGQFAGEIKEYYDELAYPKPVNNTNPIVSHNDNYSELLRIIQESNEKHTTMVVNLMSNLINGLNQKNGFINSINDIIKIKELVSEKKGDDPIKSLDVLLNTLQKGIELGQSSTDGGDNSFMDLLKTITPLVITGKQNNLKNVVSDIQNEIIKKQEVKQDKNIKYIENPIEDKSERRIENNVDNKDDNKEDDNMELSFTHKLLLDLYKPALLKMIDDKKDINEVAVYVISQVPETYYNIAFTFLNHPDRNKFIKKIIPELNNHMDWVNSVCDKLKELFVEYYKQLDKETE